MPLPLFRPGSPGLACAALAIAALLGVQACDRSDDSVTISGDVAGLDTIGLRGDSLIAQADRLPATIDSLRAVAEGKLSRPHNATAGGSKAEPSVPMASGANPMTVRAQARGDSMARAAADRLVNATARGRSQGDTVRGVVTLIETASAKQVVLRTENGTRTVALSGMATAGLSRLVGTELMIRGVMITPRDVVVSDYLVRASDGVPAFDGKLEGGDGGSYLRLTDGSGRKRIAVLPRPLRGLEGTRVWIAIKPGSSTPASYGVIGRR